MIAADMLVAALSLALGSAPLATMMPVAGAIPVCTAHGIRWLLPDGTPADTGRNKAASGCAHALCEPRGRRLVGALHAARPHPRPLP